MDDEKRYQKEDNNHSVTDLDLETINEIGEDGHTLLCNAVIANDYDKVKTLLENGASPNTLLWKKTELLCTLQWRSFATKLCITC